MNSTKKIHLAKIASAIIAIIAWILIIIFVAIKIYSWLQHPYFPAIYDQNIAIIGFIPIVGGFHPGIWCFDVAALASIIWLVLHSKEKRSH